MKKKIIALLAATAVICSAGALAACDPNPDPEPQPTPTPTEALTEGYYTYSYSVEGYGQMLRFMHFYDNGVVYYGQSGGGGTQGYIYFYEVEKAPFEYSVWYTRAEREEGQANDEGKTEDTGLHEGTADYTITVTSTTDSSVSYTIGFDGENIYTSTESFVIDDARRMRFTHDTEGEYEELGQAVVKLVTPEDADYYIQINHNGTYTDMMGEIIDEGTWTMATENGVTTYSLTSNGSDSVTATLVVNADGTGTYTPAGGTSQNVIPEQEEVVVQELVVLRGTATGKDTSGADVAYEYTLTLFDDQSYTLDLEGNGVSLTVAEGSFAPSGANYSLDVSSSTYFTEDILVNVTYNSDYTQIQSASCEIPAIDSIFLSSASLSSIISLHTLTGLHAGFAPATLEIMSDGTVTYTVEMPAAYGGTMVMDGTYTDGTDGGYTVTITSAQGTITFTVTDENGMLAVSDTTNNITLSNVDYTLNGLHAGFAAATLSILNDGTVVYVVEMPEAYGGTMVMSGTYTAGAEGGYTVTITSAQGTIAFEVAQAGSLLTVNDTTNNIVLTNAVATLTGTHAGFAAATLSLINDGTAVYVVEMPEAYGGTQVMSGTYSAVEAGGYTATITAAQGTITLTIAESDGVLSVNDTDNNIVLSSAATEE